jgi:DNA polymerase-1
MLTKDKNFVKALWENYDVHMEWAERIAHAYPKRVGGRNNLTDKVVMKDFRTDIKNQWTFPLFFGASLGSASEYLQIPEATLKPLYQAFWKQFGGVKDWQDKEMEFYKEHFYVECLTGRRRHGPLTENQIYNSPVQGTAAEIVMDAMCRLSEKNVPILQPEINIHDDLTFVRIPEKKLDDYLEQILDVMLEVPFPWVNVPISVEVSVGTNWADLQEVGKYSSAEWFK